MIRWFAWASVIFAAASAIVAFIHGNSDLGFAELAAFSGWGCFLLAESKRWPT